MGSAGYTRRPVVPTTATAEAARRRVIETSGQPGSLSGVRIAYGKITKVDPEKALIKAVELQSGAPASNGKWIVLAHSPREIAERWGKVKKGWVVQIQYTGPDGGNAIATIIKEPGENITDAKLEENSILQGLYKIFGPGIGIG